ncbi:MAG: hypothetical protein RL154_439 [Pseudomonadota bacterium]
MFLQKSTILFAACAIALFAGELENGVSSLLKKKANIDVKVVKTVDISNGLKFVIVEGKDGMQFPVLATSNGDTVTAFSKEFITSKDDVTKNINSAIESMSNNNKKATDKDAQAMYAKIPANGVLKLENGKKKTIVIVSDPDCPYCRKELESIDTKLNDANVYMIFAPVHDKSAFIKSDLIYQKAAKAKTNAEKIQILKEYFNPALKLTPKELEIKPVITEKNAEIVFGSGVVKGVPFIFELNK